MGILKPVFGEFSWKQPGWLVRAGLKRVLGGAAAVLAIAVVATLVWRYIDGLPKPPHVVATASVPGITPIVNDELVPNDLLIAFSVRADPRTPMITVESVARLDLVGKEITAGISIEPAVPGVWEWRSEKMLAFRPAEDWPAGQHYTVRYEESIFAENLLFDELELEFDTPKFRATLDELIFYQDPVDRELRNVVATLSFTHPVDPLSLERHLSLTMRESDAPPGGSADTLERRIDYDKVGRKAYIHSQRIEIPPHENFVTLTLAEDLAPVSGPSRTQDELIDTVLIPDVGSYFRTSAVNSQITRNEEDEPQQTLTIEFTDQVRVEALQEKIRLLVLPTDFMRNGQRVSNHHWRSPREVTTQIMRQAEVVDIQLNPTERDASQYHSTTIDVPENSFLYLAIEEGLESEGGFVMSVPFDTVVRAQAYPREVKIAQSGAIVPLTGDHKLTFVSRGVTTLRVDLGRLIDSEVNHVASQTQGNVETPWFNNYRFNEENVTVQSTRYIELRPDHPRNAVYSNIDLSEFLPDGGYYFINVRGWDRENDRAVGGADRRLVLVTDLGLLVKANSDSSQDVFVHSIRTGEPVIGAAVALLGKNGLPVFEGRTSLDGHASIPPTNEFEREKTPTVFVVRNGSDAIFMPYNRNDRQLQYSRFDVGGERSYDRVNADHLRAQVFSDRGIYRPGDTVNLAAIVKGDEWQALENLPLELRITDARGRNVLDTSIRLPDDGFFDQQLETTTASATGEYRAVLYLIDDTTRRHTIGSTTFSVEEFQPDRLKIRSRISGQKPRGWIQPDDLFAEVTLENLFGTAAQSRRVLGELVLRPSAITFAEYADYSFEDPLRDENSTLQTVNLTLAETTTNDEGIARLPLEISQYDKGIYELSVLTEGFEEGGGRSVRSRARIMMSPLDYLVGYKASGDMSWIDRGSEQFVDLVAVNSDAEPVDLGDLTMTLVAERYVSTLVRRPNGTYAYQSILKTEEVEQRPVAIAESGTQLALTTDEPGSFAVLISDSNGLEYSKIRYTVAGARNLAGNLERNAELDLNLRGSSFEAGETIEMEITAPYTGTGLITIERDRVYSHKWFHTDTRTSVQSIEVPAGLEGNAYVNVAFIRDLDSPEIFVSPLSYAVEPFAINRDARTIEIDINAPELVRPGDTLQIDYSTSRDARIVIYAVDEGILQVAKYNVPQPLDFFLPKMALQVGTFQMVDLILPEFEAWVRAAAPGGGEAAALAGQNLNPFQRKTEPPVVYWSGIIDASADQGSVSFEIPDYFNGRLRVMAIAVSNDAVGRYVDGATVRGPFVITPNLLTAAAPGDEFDVTVGIANNVEGSGTNAVVVIAATPSEHLEILSEPQAELQISEGDESRTTFRVRALDTFGNASLSFTASAADERVSRSATTSVRPAVAYVSTSIARSSDESPIVVPLERRLHPHFAEQTAAVSTSPLVLVDGMLSYLEVFPHYCAEQMVSKVFPQLGFLDSRDRDVDRAKIRTSFDALIGKLRTRQLSDGGFLFWPGANESAEFPSVYIMHFLTDARDQSLPVPPQMLNSGLDYLRRIAGRDVATIPEARTRAYAIYVLTRNSYVTTNYLTNLHETLDREHADAWSDDLAAVYMAASYELLKQERLGRQLMAEYELGSGEEMSSDFDTRLGRDSQYVYLLAKHFPDELDRITGEDLEKIINPIMRNRFNTLSAAYAVLALGAYTDAIGETSLLPLSIAAKIDDARQVLATANGLVRTDFGIDVDALEFSGNDGNPAFFVVSQTGFDATPPVDAKSNGLELYREYLDDAGNPVSEASIGEELTVRLRVRSPGRWRSNVAVVDLLPGGFEVLRESVRDEYRTWRPDYKDIREDRVVFYGSFENNMTEFEYRVKVTAAGSFFVPSAFAGSMYDREIEARTAPSRFEVRAAQ